MSCHWAALRKAWLHLLYCSHQVFMHIDEIPLKHLLSALKSPRSQPLLIHKILQVLNHLRGASLYSFQFVHVSFVLGSLELDPALQMCLTSPEQRGLCVITSKNQGLTAGKFRKMFNSSINKKSMGQVFRIKCQHTTPIHYSNTSIKRLIDKTA